MPELPEIEILRRSLKKNIKLAKIVKIKINNVNLRYKVPINLKKLFRGKIIKKISRVSKYLILHFNFKKKLLIHLGMSGTLHISNQDKTLGTNASFYSTLNLPKKHNHIVINLNNNLNLIYNDPRRFGYFKILNENFMKEKPLKDLGPDPFSVSFNFMYIKKYIKNKKKNIKNLLMDQVFVSGLGNIYTNEILFYCHINPIKTISKLSKKNILNIIINTRKVLLKAISFGGSTIRDFKKTDGKSGNFQQIFKVYGKQNQKCPRNKCTGLIKKIAVCNRSTFYCSKCQI